MLTKGGNVIDSERVPSRVSTSFVSVASVLLPPFGSADPLRRGFSFGRGRGRKVVLGAVLGSILGLAGVLATSLPVSAQTCPQPFVLRQESCPGGVATCTTGGAGVGGALTYQQLDRDILNTIGLCNGPGRYTWPAPGVGLLSSDGSGVITLVTDDDNPDNDSEVPNAITVSGGTLGANTVTADLTFTGSNKILMTGGLYTPTTNGGPFTALTNGSSVTGATSEGLRAAMFTLFDTKTDSVDSVALMMDCIQRTNAGAATIKRSCLHVKSYTMPDNGGDVSGILSVATGGGPGLTVYKTSHLRPTGFTDYSTSPQPAIEVGSSDAGPALIASGGVTAWGASLRNHAIEARLGSATTDGIVIWPTNNTFDDRLAFIIGSPQSNAAPINITAQIQADGDTTLKDLTLNHTSLNRITFLNSSTTLRNATNDGSSFGFTFFKSRNVGGPVTTNEILGDIGWNFVNSASGTVQGALIRAVAVDATATSEDVDISFYQNRAGTLTQGVMFKSTGKVESVATVGGDTSTTLTTKGYVDGLAAGSIADNSITEPKLKAVDTPADEECLTYESTVGDFEWQTCGGGGGNSFTTIDTTSGTDPVADSTTDTLTLTAGSGITITGDSTTDTVTIASTGGSAVDPISVPDLSDEFCARNTTSGVYGALNWSIYGANALSEVINEASHPCVQSLFTSTTSGNVNSMGMGKFSSTDNFKVADHLDKVWFVIKTDATIATTEIRLGFMDDMSNTTGGDGLFVEYDDTVNGFWRCVTRQGGTTTTTNSAVTVAINTWYMVVIERDSSNNHKCYVNSATSFATHTTNLPTGSLNLGFAIETKSAASKSMLIDYFRWLGKSITQRY